MLIVYLTQLVLSSITYMYDELPTASILLPLKAYVADEKWQYDETIPVFREAKMTLERFQTKYVLFYV